MMDKDMLRRWFWICLSACLLNACGESAKDEVTPEEGAGSEDAQKAAEQRQDAASKSGKKGDAASSPAGLAVPPPGRGISGGYRSAHGSLHVSQTRTPMVYRFAIELDSSNGCQGDISGLITLSDASHADFSVEGCELKFLFQSQQVQVSESGESCGEYHNDRCAFSSIYVARGEQKAASEHAEKAKPASAWGGRYRRTYVSSDGKLCRGWEIELSGSQTQPSAKGVWYDGDCSAAMQKAESVRYDAASKRLQLVLPDAKGAQHRFSGTLEPGRSLDGTWE